MITKAAAAAVLLAVATPVYAQGVTGGTLGVEVNAPTDLSDFGGTTYFGGIEYAINKNFSVAADISSYRFDNLGTDASSATLHGIYHMNDLTSFGLFFGQDKNETETSKVMGVEAGTEFMGGTVEGYVGRANSDTSDATIIGADGFYDWSESIQFTGGAAIANFDLGSTRTVTVGASYTISNGPDLYAEIGSVSVDDGTSTDSDTFIGLGARLNLGAERGTTFDQRSLFEILPQF